MDLSKLYPPVSYPVSRGTPMISPLIKWKHERDWHVPFQDFNSVAPLSSNGHKVVITHEKAEFRYLLDYVKDGKNLVPESALLVCYFTVHSFFINFFSRKYLLC